MLVDTHAYVGRYPFRAVGGATPDQLREKLARAGVGRAVVANMGAVFYRNAMAGNEELHSWLGGGDPDGMFVKACVINPAYPGWREDFVRCVEAFGCRLLRLFPVYHGYRLDSPECLELAALAEKLSVPLQLPCALENIRQRHRLDVDENLAPADVEPFLRKNSGADVIISNGPSLSFARELAGAAKDRRGRVFYDFARLSVFRGELPGLIKLAGADRVVFGSLAPLQYIHPQLVKLAYLDAGEDAKARIRSENAAALLGLRL